MFIFKMSKQAMRERIEEALKVGDENEIRRRAEVCLWGLAKAKDGQPLVDELFQELNLAKHGVKKP